MQIEDPLEHVDPVEGAENEISRKESAMAIKQLP